MKAFHSTALLSLTAMVVDVQGATETGYIVEDGPFTVVTPGYLSSSEEWEMKADLQTVKTATGPDNALEDSL